MERVLCIMAVSVLLAACAGDPGPRGSGEPAVRIQVAPMSYPALGFACFDVQVRNQAGTVWQKGDPTRTWLGYDQNTGTYLEWLDEDTLCSSDYGNGGGGGLAYVGPCDSTSDSDGNEANGVQNQVTLWIDGLYDATGSNDLGDWVDPCPSGCRIHVDCEPNADSPAIFDLTVMRAARQGFFDIAVDFDDIFCSAKLDTCYDATRHIELLFGAGGGRDWTAVFGLACTAGPGTGIDTELLVSRAAVVCGDVSFPLDLAADPGNNEVTVDGDTLHYGLYRGAEALLCDGVPCNKVYANIAVSLDDLVAFDRGECRFVLQATATDGTGYAYGRPTEPHSARPYVDVDVALTDTSGDAACQQHALDRDDSDVGTAYLGPLDGMASPDVMCFRFDEGGPERIGGNPVECGQPFSLLRMAAGNRHTCAIVREGSASQGPLYCWGQNTSGQIGDGTFSANRTAPVRVGTASDWTAIALGYDFSCGLRAGELWCWGSGWSGKLGNGTTAETSVPVRVGGAADWVRLAAGTDHACGIRATGQLYCWGANGASFDPNFGRLGDGTTTARWSPVPIDPPGGPTVAWSDVTAGQLHTCGIHLGALYCWGFRGTIGDGTTTSSKVPMRVGTETDWTRVTSRVVADFTCGLRGAALSCWGGNAFAQLGNGSTGGAQLAPGPVSGSITPWDEVSAGARFACALSNGRLFCWGSNNVGAVGGPDSSNVTSPLQVGTATDWQGMAPGEFHNCGVRAGRAFCWGYNENGQLGDGTTGSSFRPTPSEVLFE